MSNETKNKTKQKSIKARQTQRHHVLHLPLPTRVTSLVLSRLALLAQELVDVALRRHRALLHRRGHVHGRLLLLLLLGRRRLMLMRGHRRVLVAVQALGRVLLGFRIRIVVVQRRVEREVAAHGGAAGLGWAGRAPWCFVWVAVAGC